MSRRKNAPYTGILKKPRTHFLDYLNETLKEKDSVEDAVRAASERWDADYQERLAALCTHFQIDLKSPHLWQELIEKLAEAHVPGFTVSEPGRPYKSRGAPEKWDAQRDIQLYLAVEGKKYTNEVDRKPKESIKKICRDLAGKEPWRSFAPSARSASSAGRSGGVFAETLKRRYFHAKSKYQNLTGPELLRLMGPPRE